MSQINLDVLVKGLRQIDAEAYNSPLTCKVLKHLNNLNERTQRAVIKNAIGHDISYDQLMEHIRMQFRVLKQVDQEGQYCGLGYGKACVSVATWNGWQIPKHASDVDITISTDDRTPRCSPMLDFAELWMDHYDASFEDFLNGVETSIN